MYKVVFVDDEPWVIIDILHSIPWEKLGFEVAGHYNKASPCLCGHQYARDEWV
jgi:YesN/AraC family two-component response regulator